MATGVEDQWIEFILLERNSRKVFSYHKWSELQDKYIIGLKKRGLTLKEITTCINYEFKIELTTNAIQQRLKTLKME